MGETIPQKRKDKKPFKILNNSRIRRNGYV